MPYYVLACMLNLADQTLLKPLLRSCQQQLSEYTFANLYLFRNVHAYEIVHGLDLYIKGVSYDGLSFLMPTSAKSFQALLADKEEYSRVDMLFPIPEEWLQMVDKKIWKAGHSEADSDYIYDTLQLSRYSGRDLSKKRNLVKQFTEHYQVEEVSFDAQNALVILDAWKKNAMHAEDDALACREAIENFALLSLEGKIYRIDSKPVGLMIGEALNADTFVLHFAKADISYKGIYQYMYQAYAKTLQERFAFINMEQDMGSASLRQAKHSYGPIRMCHKVRLTRAVTNV